MKNKTEAAQVAAIVRAELKAKFPGVVFTVRSQTYSGGDSVNVGYVMENESYPRQKEVESIVKKYQAGHFDGMTDSYDYTYKGTGKTVLYAFVDCDTRKIQEKHKQAFLSYWGLSAFDDTEIMKKLGVWKEQALYRFVNDKVLV